MDKETYEALKDIITPLEHSHKTNDFSYFILNGNPVRNNLVQIRSWIDEVAKEYIDDPKECKHDWDNYGKCCNCGKWNH